MNCKAKGSRNERKTIRMLETLGYRCIKAAASLGVFDIIGIGQNDVICVQVKSNDWPRSTEMATLAAFPCPPNVRKIVHRWKDRATQPDIREIGEQHG